MTTNLGSKAFYVQTDDKLIYKVSSMEMYDGYNSLRLNLELILGWDYIHPDVNNVQGWCKADRFNDEVQSAQEICYIMEESITECLEANGYEIIENISDYIIETEMKSIL